MISPDSQFPDTNRPLPASRMRFSAGILAVTVLAAGGLAYLLWRQPNWQAYALLAVTVVSLAVAAASLSLVRGVKHGAAVSGETIPETGTAGVNPTRQKSDWHEALTLAQVHSPQRQDGDLQAILEISKTVCSLLTLDELLPQAAQLIGDRFGYLHSRILLLDAAGEKLELRASYNSGGQALTANSHSDSLINRAVVEQRYQVSPATSALTDISENPDMSAKTAEAAIPLNAGNEILGVLDLYSDRVDPFSEGELDTLQSLAGQVAIAVENARRFEENLAALEKHRETSGELSQYAWKELLNAEPTLGVRCDQSGRLYPISGTWTPDMVLAGELGQTIQTHFDEVALPIRFNNMVGGVIRLRKQDGETWTREELAFMETIAEQLSIALESARLHSQVQQRAAHERLVGEAAARMRQSLDVDLVLRTATEEIYRALNLHDVTIRISPPAEGSE